MGPSPHSKCCWCVGSSIARGPVSGREAGLPSTLAAQVALRSARGMRPIVVQTTGTGAERSTDFPDKMRRNVAPDTSHSLAMVRAFALLSGPKPGALGGRRSHHPWEELQ